MENEKIFILLILGLATPVPITSYGEPISTLAGAASVSLTLNGIKEMVSDSIDKGQNAGDYLLFKGGTELKSVISSWEAANKNLLDKSFSELNESQRKFINNLNATATQLNSDVTDHAETALRITELANQSIQDLRVFDGNLGLFRYSPRIAYAGLPQDINFIIRGVNFDKADPKLVLPSGKEAKRVSLTRQEAIYTFSSNEFKFDDTKSSFTTLKLKYLAPSNSFWGKLKDKFDGRTSIQTTEISILQLPIKLGDFTVSYKTIENLKETWDGSGVFHYSGKNTSHIQNQGPHDNGWKIVISSLKKVKEWGQAGKSCTVESINEYGFSIRIDVGVIINFPSIYADAYQHCLYNWQEFKESQYVKDSPEIAGRLRWNVDSAVSLPENLKSFKLFVNTWDGKSKIFNGTKTETFYSIEESNGLLVIKPKIPKDLNSF
ncbi:hypothetical protein NQU59_11660 [Acinetobacter colistiniresistens]|uniref:hypothetical protein n=1 Tax=Acinetobacter colistiniresistens TaxID=280145 RepID=UPI00211CB2A2|nr:hypothetical protein [Acinetobacter colistiniresistens]UUM26357.1 hypothetical protein NQU59_11660 [Acinetobacter colistiniresistens]